MFKPTKLNWQELASVLANTNLHTVSKSRRTFLARLPAMIFFATEVASTAGRLRDDLPWNERRYTMFGGPDGWVLLDVHNHHLDRIRFPSPFVPQNIDVSPDGSLLVFTAFDTRADNTLLFQWHRLSKDPPLSIGDTRGYHSDPVLTPDQEWVYFAHHPNALGPPGHHVEEHVEKSYAQIYRVRINGKGLQPLTAENGCHFAPVAMAQKLFFVHTSCGLERWIVQFDIDTHTAMALETGKALFDELSISPDRARLLCAARSLGTITIKELNLLTSQWREILTVSHDRPRIRPRYGSNRDEILYQLQGSVWAFDGRRSTVIADLEEV